MEIAPMRGGGPRAPGRGTLPAFVLLAVPSLLVIGGWLAYRANPARVVEAETEALGLLRAVATPWLLPALAAVLLWPPVMPTLRLLGRRLARRLTFDRKRAAKLLRQLSVLEAVPDLVNLGRCYLDGGWPERAVPVLARAVEREPSSAVARLLLARALTETRRPDEALAVLEPALAADPRLHFGDGLELAAQAALEAGHPADALAFAESHRRAYGPRPALLWLEVRALEDLGRRTEAVQRLGEILTLEKAKGERPEDALARARARVRSWLRRVR